MTVDDIMAYLEEKGSDQTKSIYLKHGAPEPFFGVKVGDLKPIQKKLKKNLSIALELYKTGNSDAMYLAGLIADESQITKEQLQVWAEQASWYMISEYAVAWTAADSPYGWELGLEWIDSPKEHIASAGWATLSNWLMVTPNDELDINEIKTLMERASAHVHEDENRVSYTMNGFIIAAGGQIPELTQVARNLGDTIGKVNVQMGSTNCKVPVISEYVKKMEQRGNIGKKRKTARC
ncbi:MAG: DNA alkylation repair protein [Bacteroidota bacterium]